MSLKIECHRRRKLPTSTEALSYRLPMHVTKFLPFPDGSTFPLCPRCDHCLDREYMDYCNCCGQHLSWHYYP